MSGNICKVHLTNGDVETYKDTIDVGVQEGVMKVCVDMLTAVSYPLNVIQKVYYKELENE